MRRLGLLVLLAGLLLAGSVRAQTVPDGLAWIDAPLATSLVTLTPVDVVAHASDPDGVVELRLDLNGVTIASAAPTSGSDTLATATMSWTPAAEGLYRLEVFPRDSGGEWGTPGIVRIHVDPGATTTTTTTTTTSTTSTTTATTTTTTTTSTLPGAVTSTTRPIASTTTPVSATTTQPAVVPTTAAAATTTTIATTTTAARTTTTVAATTTTTVARTTTTVCDVGVPTPVGADRTDTLTPVLSWSYDGCREPEQFHLELSRDSGFARLEQEGRVGPGTRSWTTGALGDCTTYYWRIRTVDFGTPGTWSGTASFHVQTVRAC